MPTMTEKVKLNRERAQVALDAYMTYDNPEGFDHSHEDALTEIGDLLADLLHLADAKWNEAEAEYAGGNVEVAIDGRVTATGLMDRAFDHYTYERDPAHADEEV